MADWTTEDLLNMMKDIRKKSAESNEPIYMYTQGYLVTSDSNGIKASKDNGATYRYINADKFINDFTIEFINEKHE